MFTRYRKIFLYGFIVLLPGLASDSALAVNPWTFPPLPPPWQYGNVLINRISTKDGVKPVGFSHWSHRLHYTCRVCHSELGFNMVANTTKITEEKNLKGQYCGACHNGKIAFAPGPLTCARCHSGTITQGKTAMTALRCLPKTAYGNKIDWSYALYEGLIHPKSSLTKDYKPVTYNKKITIESAWEGTPAAIFPHDVHNDWLDCSSCHPDIFSIKKNATKHFAMKYILQGKFCGYCHLKVAFPLNDCKRCHPKMKK